MHQVDTDGLRRALDEAREFATPSAHMLGELIVEGEATVGLREALRFANWKKAGARIYFWHPFRRMPTASAAGWIESEAQRRKGLGETRLLGTFRSTRVLGIRRRRAPRHCQEKSSLGRRRRRRMPSAQPPQPGGACGGRAARVPRVCQTARREAQECPSKILLCNGISEHADGEHRGPVPI